MDKLSSRQMDIVKKILNNENVTVKKIAQVNDVSTRTIYREIDSINKAISQYKVKIINTIDGMYLNGKEDDILEFKFKIQDSTSIAEAKNRNNFIIAELLQCKEPIKIQYFARKFNVSSSTISHDIKEVKEWLDRKNLSLISKQGVGVYIEGDEKNIRHALVDLLYENYNIEQLIDFIQNGSQESITIQNSKMEEINHRLLNIIDYKTIHMIEKSLYNIESTMEYKFDDRLYIELSIHLSLAIERLRNNEKISFDGPTLENLKKSKEYQVAKAIAQNIEKAIDIKIPQEELGYITVHLQGLKFGENALGISEKYLYSITEEVVNEASRIFNTNFENDSMLKNDLNMHLLYSIDRLKSGYKIRNPLISEIKRQYGEIFDKCDKVLNLLRQKLNAQISEDEVGYISMHFAAAMERMKEEREAYNVLLVCASGIGTSRMLAARMKKIREINIVGVSSVLKIDEIIHKTPVDFIISTVPIKRNDKKVIIINPLLEESDISKLEKELNIKISMDKEERGIPIEKKLENAEKIKAYSYEINVIIKNTLLAEVEAGSAGKIIEALLEEQVSKQIISYVAAKNIEGILKNREGMGTIIIPDKKFVIYHCVSKDIQEPIITVGKLRKSIMMINLIGKNELVCTAFLMVAPENNKESLEVIGDLSSSIIEQADFVGRLSESKSTKQCRQVIEKTLIKSLYSQIVRTFK
ncbi:BglG family transcription antiterminator [Clostridium sp. 19966]|uniref:BglG family transcription antiterminator n=1 Tax=Clostridium sp. 19966 TaxID=2768166 RepID=UPI0028DF385D|nr:BglG family transcription antiterminator [Clostridium sp. 19966]MDT8716196.1 BglG family transcription antiterminator [Clostridium sp. 19966]